MSVLFYILIFLFSLCLNSNVFAQSENIISEIEVFEKFVREDGMGEAIIIRRDINDTSADRWVQEYIKSVKNKLNKLERTKASGCSNLDFENGDFSNWTCQKGTNNGYPAGNWVTTTPIANRHVIVSAGIDPYGGFPMLAPGGGNFSVRLGNNLVGAQAEQLIYSFIVQPQDTSFIYKYAVVFQNPNHTLYEQPYFEVKILDNNGQVLPCSYQRYIASANIPGFSHVGNNIWYKPWTTQGVNLTNYVGQIITVIVTSADCSRGGHFGYGYIDFICPSSFTISPEFHEYCENVTSTTLYVPNADPGMAFNWSTGQTTSSITINPQLYGDSIIKCYVYYPSSPQCGFWYVFHIKILHSPQVSINPATTILCYGQTSTTLTAEVSGGNPPYTFLWNNGANTQSISAGVGNYNVLVYDASGCPPVSASVTITANSAPITVYAGPDQTLCINQNSVNLSGNVTIATGGIWSGGNGTFSPSNTSLQVTYYPTLAEIQSGSINLVLTSTGNGTCPAVSDTVKINFRPFIGNITTSINNVTCFGLQNGTAQVSVVNGTPPFSYQWNTNPIQTSQTATQLSAGNYTVTITDGIGCTAISNVIISQPQPLTAYVQSTPVSCFGNNDGYASVTAYGGTPGYSYLWSNGATTPTIVGLYAGNYYVTISDANGCTYVNQATIGSPDPLVASIQNVNHVLCANTSTGSATVYVTGGTPSYTYNWSSNAGTSNTAIGLTAGVYTVTVTDANNCVTTASIVINSPSPLQVQVIKNSVSCFGGNDGSASAIVTGGSPPYNYAWYPLGGTSSQANNLFAGNYTLSVTDANGCQNISSFTITQPDPFTINVNTQNVLCYGTNTGFAQIQVNGGTPGYSYTWNPNVSQSQSAIGLSAGTYFVTIKDANQCSQVVQFFINQPGSPLSVNLNVQNVSCYGFQNGSILATTSGGTPPYQYIWMPGGSTSQSITGLSEGNYFVTITDANGCSVVQSVSISQPQSLQIQSTIVEANCGMSNGQASVNVTGGLSPYTYLWTPGNYTSNSIAGVPSGIYNVVVTDANGCSSSKTIAINDQAGPQVSLVNYTNPSCFGAHNGSITISASNGQPPYLYAWYPYGGNNVTANNLGAGTYSVIVSDANGCQGVLTAPLLTQPQAISVAAFPINVTCAGSSNGSISIQVSGGTPPYSYLWSPGNYTIPNPIGLSSGIYQLTITDANNCTETVFVNISEPLPLSASITNLQHVSCYGGNNGSISVNVQGGTPPYSFLWSPSGITSPTASGLSAGTHIVYITDAKGCSYSLSVQLTQPPLLSNIISYSIPSCFNSNDGKAWVLVNGGTPPYSFTWSPIGGNSDTAYNLPAGNYVVTVTDMNSCQIINHIQIPQPTKILADILTYGNVSCYNSNNGFAIVSVTGGTPPYSYNWSTGSNLSNITNLLPGVYYVTITDSKGCTATDSITITQPLEALNLIIQHQNVSCYNGNDGYALANVSGGTPPYQYVWVPNISYSEQINNLIAGTYTVSVIDNNGCMISNSVNILQPPKLIANSAVLQPVSCYGTPTGSATVQVNGGTPSYSYNWSTVPSQTSQQANNIFSGIYYVTVIDANGCTAVDSVYVPQPPQLQAVVVSQNNVSCYQGNDGYISSGAIGGTPPYSFYWNTNPPSNSSTASNLSAGTYTLQVSDNNGCTSSIQVNLTQPSQVLTYVSNDIYICLGESATLNANAFGGTPPYIFNWHPNIGSQSNIYTVSPFQTTQFIVTAYDSKGCRGLPDTVTVYVKKFTPNNVHLTAESPICPGNISAIILYAEYEHGDTLYYNWSSGLGPGSGPFLVAPTTPTWYHVTISNTCNISVVDSVLVNMAPGPIIQFSTNTTQGCMPLEVVFTDSSIKVFDEIESWIWHFGDGNISTEQNPSHIYTHPGTYYAWLELQTHTGCTSSSENHPLTIYVFEKPIANFVTNKEIYYIPNDPVICTNLSTGAISYYWNFGDGTTSTNANPIHRYNQFGTFTITMIATNTYQCTDTVFREVKVSGDIVFPNAFTPDPSGPNGGYYSNNDYSNHVFFPVAKGVSEFKMQIFNRWGELVFETNDINIGWDGYYKGRLCEQGVYVYQAKATFIDGRIVEKKGDVLLIR